MQAESDRPVRTFTIGFRRMRLTTNRPSARRSRAISRPITPKSRSTPRHALNARARHRRMVRRTVRGFLATADLSGRARQPESTSPSRFPATAATNCSPAIRNTHGSTDFGALPAALPRAACVPCRQCCCRLHRKPHCNRSQRTLLDAARAERIGEKARRLGAALRACSATSSAGARPRRHRRQSRAWRDGRLSPDSAGGSRQTPARSGLAHAGQ